MASCHALLGIPDTALTDEIEEAYRAKKIEFSAAADASKLQELETAYNEAIMATFAPIRAFASPLPPLAAGKKSPQPVQPPPQYTYAAPKPQSLAEAALSEDALTEDAVPFSDDELLNMDVSELRKGYMPEKQGAGAMSKVLSLGIENKLLRFYARTYAVLVVFDIIMRLSVGPVWLLSAGALMAGQGTIPPVSAPLSVIFAFISLAVGFVCAIPLPFVIRFSLLGQPPQKSYMTWLLFYTASTFAYLARKLFGYFLPLNVLGSEVTFMIAAMALSLGTLRHTED